MRPETSSRCALVDLSLISSLVCNRSTNLPFISLFTRKSSLANGSISTTWTSLAILTDLTYFLGPLLRWLNGRVPGP